MKRWMVFFCVAAAATAEVGSASQEPVAGDEAGELPVVLSASRLNQPAAEAPAAISVIDRETIALTGARQVSELFPLIPGFVVGHLSGNSPVVAYHGLSDPYSRRMQVLVDGVSIYSPLYGGVEWSELPIAVEDIDRIEVVRGPNAASYGANAFLGTVNIITRDPATDRGLGLRVNAGESGIGDTSFSAAGHGDAWRYRISAGQRADKGFPGLPDSSRVNYANLRAHLRLTDQDELSVILRQSVGVLEQGYYDNAGNGPRQRDTETRTLNLRWTRALGPDDEIWAQFSSQRRRNQEALDLAASWRSPLPPNPVFPFAIRVSSDYESRRDELEFQQTLRLGADLRGVWGGQYRRDGVRSNPYFHREEWVNSDLSRLFGNLEWSPLRGVLVHGGVMFETNSITGGSLSPRLSLSLTPVPGHTLRAGASVARRTPTLFESHGNQSFDMPASIRDYLRFLLTLPLPPPTRAAIAGYLTRPLFTRYLASGNVGDERVLSREITYIGSLAGTGTHWELRWFSDQFKGMVAPYRVPYSTPFQSDTTDFANREWVREHGLELSLKARPWAGGHVQVAASRNIIESSSADEAASGPVGTFSALVGQELPGAMTAGIGYRRTGSFTWLGTGGTALPAWDAWNFRLGRRFQWGGERVELAWVTQHARGRELEIVNTVPRQRASFVQLRIGH
ncbi:MAG: TonB-dependent receptor [Rhodocyclaceae bacterium]|nr:TonB-dependent receptor [Rhodocyclaceae bacterium]